MNAPTDQDLIGFVVHEARLIDQHRFEEWLALFADDGHYWMPLEWGQTDPRLATSLMYEDKLLLQIRIERLKGNRTFSQKPKSRCHHVLQMPQIDKRDEVANEYVTWTPMHYVETRLDEQSLEFHRKVRAAYHQLAEDEPKRVKLIDGSREAAEVAGAVWSAMQVLLAK